MRGGKEHASTRQTRSSVPDDEPRGSGSNPTLSTETNVTPTDVSGSNNQPSGSNVQSGPSQDPGVTPESNGSIYQDILVDCNTLVEKYRKGEISKASAYIDIQSKLSGALGDDRTRSDAAFGSFIATIESHDTEVGAASRRGLRGEPRMANQLQRSPSPFVSDADDQRSDGEPVRIASRYIDIYSNSSHNDVTIYGLLANETFVS